jgi:RND family efflux transporter MFP subunit
MSADSESKMISSGTVSDQLSEDLASLRMPHEPEPKERSFIWKVITSVGAVVIIGVLAFVYGPELKARAFRLEVETAEIALVSPAQASVTVTTSGRVVAQKQSRIGITSPGRVAKVHVKEGDVVKEGDPLLELDDAGDRSAVAAARARTSAARARAEAARASMEEVKTQIDRERVLVERGVSGKAKLDDLNARLHSLEKQANAAEAETGATAAEADTHRVNLEGRTIHSPIAGTIISKPPTIGELVGPASDAILEIADFGSLVIETDVPEGKLHLVTPGTPCEIVLDAYPTKRYRGATLEIGRRVDQAKGTIPVKVRFVDEMEGALPGMSARASFLTRDLDPKQMKEPPRRVVPEAAIVERNGEKGVFVLEEDRVSFVTVKLVKPFGGGIELIEGPQEGVRVVMRPPDELAHGKRVKAKER